MKNDEQIAEALRQATAGLWMMSESDYPFEVIRWEQTIEVTPAQLRRMAAQPADALVATESVDDFFRAAVADHEGQSEEAHRVVLKFRELLQLLKTNLQDVRVYKVGQVNIPVYILGRAPSGSWMGLSTRIVET